MITRNFRAVLAFVVAVSLASLAMGTDEQLRWELQKARPEGLEAQVLASTMEKDGPATRLKIVLDYEHGTNPKYPLGWPGCTLKYPDGLDVSGYTTLEGWVYVSIGDAEAQGQQQGAVAGQTLPLPEPAMKLGLRFKGAEKGLDIPIKARLNTWVKNTISLKQPGAGGALEMAYFYVAESWYKAAGFESGQEINFYFSGFKFTNP